MVFSGGFRIFPEWFGAVGNGVTDDSIAIAKAWASGWKTGERAGRVPLAWPPLEPLFFVLI